MGWFGESDEELLRRYWKGVWLIIEQNRSAYRNILNQWDENHNIALNDMDGAGNSDFINRGMFKTGIFAIEIGMIKIHQKKGDDKHLLDVSERTCIELARHSDEDGTHAFVSKANAKQMMEKNNYASNIHKALIDKNTTELAELYFVALEECIKDIRKGKNRKVWMPTAMATAVNMIKAVDQDWG